MNTVSVHTVHFKVQCCFIVRSPLRPALKLSISTLNQTNIPPKEIVAYNKETQTPVIQKSTESGE